MKKNEIKLILCIVLIAAVSFLVCSGMFTEKGAYVCATINGKVYGYYPLNQNDRIRIETDEGYNILIIEEGNVSISEANCRDHICENHIAISCCGESIICLPHKLVIEIESQQTNTLDGVSY